MKLIVGTTGRSGPIAFFLYVATILLCVAGCTKKPKEAEPTGDVLAKVNGTPILRSEFERQYEVLARQIKGPRRTGLRTTTTTSENNTYSEKGIKKRVLDELIARELQFQEAQRRGLKVPADVAERTWRNAKRGSGSNVILTDEEFAEKLAASGRTLEDYRQELHKVNLITVLARNETRNLTVKENEIQSSYEQDKDSYRKKELVRAGCILVKLPENPSEEQNTVAIEKIKLIQKLLDEGKPFEEIAGQYSDPLEEPPFSNGGFFDRESVDKPIADAVFELEPGEVTAPIRTESGYHMLKVVAKRPGKVWTLDDVRGRIRSRIATRKSRDAIEKLVAKLKEEADIEYLASP